MSRRYDSRTTIFSPEGRLYQVEYAMEAISNAGTVLGITFKDGILLVAERKVTSRLLEDSSAEKLYYVHESMICGVAGITSDANSLINYARMQAQRFLYTFNEVMPSDQLVHSVCDLKQGYTQYGGLRPYGVSFLYASYDPVLKFKLFHSDPSGNFAGWRAHCIGSGNQAASAMLKTEYKDDMTRDEAYKLASRILLKTLDASVLSADKLELATIMLENNEPVCKILSRGELEDFIK